jgi:flagellar motility protein MotE (MotC chaperone)
MAQRRNPAAATNVRLLPAAMVMIAATLGVKAVAVAEGVSEAAPVAAQAATQTAQAAAAPAATPTPGQCPAPSLAEMAGLSQSEVQVLQALSARREALDQRASQFEGQDELLAAAERRLDQRLAELRQLEATVNDLLGNLDQAQEQRIVGLVDVYQRMRAKDAAAVFDGLEDDVLVQVAGRMRQANLAEVMGRMQPTRARHLTEMLADRARPPTEGADLLTRARTAPAQPGG